MLVIVGKKGRGSNSLSVIMDSTDSETELSTLQSQVHLVRTRGELARSRLASAITPVTYSVTTVMTPITQAGSDRQAPVHSAGLRTVTTPVVNPGPPGNSSGDLASLLKYMMEKEDRDRREREAKEDRDRRVREAKEDKDRRDRLTREENDRAERQRQWNEWMASQKGETKPVVMPRSENVHFPDLHDSDDVDRYLDHFERVAHCQEWDRSTWALKLSVRLTGRAREAFDQLPLDKTHDYQALKAALLRVFRSTPEVYRTRFRTARKTGTESFPQFAERLQEMVKRWVTLAGKQESYADLRDLMVQEQLLDSVTDDLALFVRERAPKSAAEAAEIAEHFVEARRATKAAKESKRRSRNQGGSTDQQTSSATSQGGNKDKLKDKCREGPKTGCYQCGGKHYKRDCPELSKTNRKEVVSVAQVESLATSTMSVAGQPCQHRYPVTVEGREVVALRDTGASTIMVSADLVPSDKEEVGTVQLSGVEAKMTVTRPVVLIEMSTPFFHGKVKAVVLSEPMFPVIIGNRVDYASGETSEVPVRGGEECQAVETRGQKLRQQGSAPHGPKVEEIPYTGLSPAEFREKQHRDPTLRKYWEYARSKHPRNGTPKEGKARYVVKDNLLYRQFSKKGQEYNQLMVPSELRATVLRISHDQPMAGHLGCRKTLERVWQTFYWPGLEKAVKEYCRSCDACQRTVPRGKVRKVPLGQMPLVSEPFQRVAVDIVGPIIPLSERKNRYILVVVDCATRYPEAVPLRNIDTETVAEALWIIWTRVGVPLEVLSDRGTQFTSETMASVRRLLGIKGVTTTPYHLQEDGLVERFNATLKSMLKKLCAEKPKDWDCYIPAALFAYREVPQESTGYAPFELMYGRRVRGPSAILKQMWTGADHRGDAETRTVSQYVIDLQRRIEDTCLEAQRNLKQASKRYAKYFNKKAQERMFETGSKVLLLLPEKNNKLQVAWRGPYEVLERIGDWDYRIRVKNKEKVFHANLLKQYVVREEAAIAPVVADQGEEETPCLQPQGGIPLLPLQAEEGVKDVRFGPELPPAAQEDLVKLCEEFADILTDVPLRSTEGECEIQLDTPGPVRTAQYPLPHSKQEQVSDEVQQMLKLGVIEPAASPFSSPITLVRKKDGKIRFCVDFRRLNKRVKFDGEPLPDVDTIFSQLGKAKYFSKIDLSKGYWQIPMRQEDKPKTAFTTPSGQYQWTVMPFGLKTAGAIFSRVMRRILEPLHNPEVHNFMDDVLVASEVWRQHLRSLRQVFQRLQQVNMSARPTKCLLGATQTSFLGHQVGEGKLWPEDDKVQRLVEADRPTNKKQLRSFLGLAGYYRKFVPGYSDIALPLTNRTKKTHPEKVRWDSEAESAFNRLKESLTCRPVLALPVQTEPFTLRTDASGTGLGAVLLQERDQRLHPIAYASKKLSEAERKYHTVELECYAVVWGIRKFYPYLYGRHFMVESDHHPLRYLERIRPISRRLMGWALELQSHDFEVRCIAGKDNVGADYLSRLFMD